MLGDEGLEKLCGSQEEVETVLLGQTFRAAVIARAAQQTKAEELDRPEPASSTQSEGQRTGHV